MRVVIGMCLGVCSVLGGLLSCAAEEARSENQMDLTLGGNNKSLRRDLETLGVVPRRGSQPRSVAPEPVLEPEPAPEPVFEPEPAPEPVFEPEPEPEWRVVTLREGETLYGLASVHLGRGSRWPEIARLNGWSERQAEQLRIGTQVRLPQK
ncbi:MAG: LysM peptidoglycan-binding domain-containing protein [Planctomycetota bacterium]